VCVVLELSNTSLSGGEFGICDSNTGPQVSVALALGSLVSKEIFSMRSISWLLRSACALAITASGAACGSSGGSASNASAGASAAGTASSGAVANGGSTSTAGASGTSPGPSGGSSAFAGMASAVGGAAGTTGAGTGGATGAGTGGATGAGTGGRAAAGAGGPGNVGGNGSGGSAGGAPRALSFGPYKDVGINMNWNTNVISTKVSGVLTGLVEDLVTSGVKSVTLAFASGECGHENWAGLAGDILASTNVPLLEQAGIKYVVSTGGAAGVFSCATDAGMSTFLGRWASDHLVGLDLDIEAGQSESQIADLIARIPAAHAAYPTLRFSLTLATLATNDGDSTAKSLGASAPDSFNTLGDQTLSQVKKQLGFAGSAATWPPYLTVALMVMDYGAASPGVCVVANGSCDMGQSAIQAAHNLHDKWGVPYANIELTPMIGGNDAVSEQFTLADVDTLAAFALARGLAGVHSWSYDRDLDCAKGSASSSCNSMGDAYAGPRGYLKRFLAAGLK